jgi:AmmeMemoRadiSam system protein B/AmmeMemoRadiSam system protein A
MGINLKSQDALRFEDITHRPPTVAGLFYPASPDELRNAIKDYLDKSDVMTGLDDIIGLISPHAGHVYSGWVAAKGYKNLIGRNYDAVIILAPSHHKTFKGASVFNGEAYSTPLGIVKVDDELAIEIARNHPYTSLSLKGHEWNDSASEHSIEVQLPFLQIVLPGVPIVPITVGISDKTTDDIIALTIYRAVKKLNRKVLVIASTDLSHFYEQRKANEIDREFIDIFSRYDYFRLGLDYQSGKVEACGGNPVLITMLLSEMLGATASLPLMYATSANSPYTNSSPNKVVGYFSGLLIKSDKSSFSDFPDFTPQMKDELFKRAMTGIEAAIKSERMLPIQAIPMDLNFKLAAFVTLRKDGKLRSCMGHTYPKQSVVIEVEESARMAATSDPRFDPIKLEEIPELDVEITLLSRFRRIFDTNDVIAGIDGALLQLNGRTGLFLPQVASDNNLDRTQFLEQLGIKAGLNTAAYLDPNAEIYTFRTLKLVKK